VQAQALTSATFYIRVEYSVFVDRGKDGA
jgi:hypothetical protein